MTDEMRRIRANSKHFTYSGQPIEQWPSWLVFTNFATNGRDMIIVHLLDEKMVVYLGDTITWRPDGSLKINRKNILRFPEPIPTLNGTAKIEAA